MEYSVKDNIERYLTGQMPESEQADFLSKVQENPEYSDLFQFEKNITDGIKEARKAELKNMLSEVPVSYQPGILESLGTLKTGGILLATATAITIGTYFYTAETEIEKIQEVELAESAETEAGPESTVQEEMFPASDEDFNSNQPVDDRIDAERELSTKNTGIRQDVGEKMAESEISKQELSRIEAEDITVKNEVETINPDLVDDFNDEMTVPNSGNIKIKEPESMAATKPSTLAVETVNDNIHDFHYRFYNDKLYLYGDFSGNPYEILELNKPNGRSVFLYYDDSYYQINENQENIDALKKITSRKTIEELENIRN
jgi:hypothetical protein